MTLKLIEERRMKVWRLFQYGGLPPKTIAEDVGLSVRSVQRIIAERRAWPDKVYK